MRWLWFLVCLSATFLGCRRPTVVDVGPQENVQAYQFKSKRNKPIKLYNPSQVEVNESLPKEYFSPFIPIGEYVIAVGDSLEITLYGDEEEFVRQTVVAPDGYLYFLFVDGVKAAGRSVRDVAAEIESRLTYLFINPEVAIIPQGVSGQEYWILGQVISPGVYPINASLTIRQAIGEAGGLAYGGYRGTSFSIANLKNSFIIRDGRRLPIDFDRLVYSEGADQDIYVRPGDYIYISSSLTNQIYLIGAVVEQKPVPYRDGMTLVGSLSGPAGLTGGTTTDADLTRITIVRGSLTNPIVLQANWFDIVKGLARDVYLEPGDIVFVPNKKFRYGRQLIRAAIDSFVKSFGNAAGEYWGGQRWFPPPAGDTNDSTTTSTTSASTNDSTGATAAAPTTPTTGAGS